MIPTFLLDTNIVIYLSKNINYAKLYQEDLLHAECLISFMTVSELYEGAFRAGWTTPSAGKILDNLKRYAVIPFDDKICKIFGQIRAARKNRPISVPDAFVAATAMAYGLSLVTHNLKDFEDISTELKIVSEYKPPE